MDKLPKIAVVGCGHMGQAIAHSLLQKGFKDIWLANDKIANLLLFLKNHAACCKKSYVMTSDNKAAAAKNNYVLLCVKPAQMKEALGALKPVLKKNHVLISIAAGVPIKALQKWSGCKKIARVMPNLAAQVGAGISVWKTAGLNSIEKKNAQNILESFGETIEVKSENLINAATAVSGSGPAYVFAFLEALQKSAADFGFPESDSRKLALMTVCGAAYYAAQQTDPFGDLKERVKTKGGTTEAAFKILDKKQWQKTLEAAIKNARERAEKISRHIR